MGWSHQLEDFLGHLLFGFRLETLKDRPKNDPPWRFITDFPGEITDFPGENEFPGWFSPKNPPKS